MRAAFFAWCEQRGLTLTAIRPFDVSTWVNELQPVPPQLSPFLRGVIDATRQQIEHRRALQKQI